MRLDFNAAHNAHPSLLITEIAALAGYLVTHTHFSSYSSPRESYLTTMSIRTALFVN